MRLKPWLSRVLYLLTFTLLSGGCIGPQPGPELTSISIDTVSSTLEVGTSSQLTVTGTFSDQSKSDVTSEIRWSISSAAVATLSPAGLLKGVTVGTATVVATDTQDPTITTQLVVTVTNGPLTAIQIAPKAPQVPAGLQLQFSANAVYADQVLTAFGGALAWSSSDTTIATIDPSSGLAQAIKPGTVTITAQDPVSHLSGTATLTVTAALIQSIEVSLAAPHVAAGQTDQARANGHFSDGSIRDVTASATWSSTDSAIAAASLSGLVTGNTSGGPVSIQASLTPTNGGAPVTGSASLTVTAAVLTSIAISTPSGISTSETLATQVSQQLKAIGTYSDSSTADLTSAVVWVSSNSSVASTTSGGLLTTLDPGGASSTVTATDPVSSIAGSLTVTVTAPALSSLTVTSNVGGSNITQAGTYQFSATGSYADGSQADLTSQVVWSSSNLGTLAVMTGGAQAGSAQASASSASAGQTVQVTATLGAISGTSVMFGFTATFTAQCLPKQTLLAGGKATLSAAFVDSVNPIGALVSGTGDPGDGSALVSIAPDPIHGDISFTHVYLTAGSYTATLTLNDGARTSSCSTAMTVVQDGTSGNEFLVTTAAGVSGSLHNLFVSPESGDEVRSVNVGAGGTLVVTLSYTGSTPPTLSFYNSTTQSFETLSPQQTVVDTQNKTVTYTFGGNSSPSVNQLNG